jgi:hypothetical protein
VYVRVSVCVVVVVGGEGRVGAPRPELGSFSKRPEDAAHKRSALFSIL